jgi:hypothetical protein
MKLTNTWANNKMQMIIQVYEGKLFCIYQEPDFTRYFFLDEDDEELVVLELSENDFGKAEET